MEPFSIQILLIRSSSVSRDVKKVGTSNLACDNVCERPFRISKSRSLACKKAKWQTMQSFPMQILQIWSSSNCQDVNKVHISLSPCDNHLQRAFDMAKTRFLSHKVLADKQQWIGGSSDTNVDLQSKGRRFESSKGINISRLSFFFFFFLFQMSNVIWQISRHESFEIQTLFIVRNTTLQKHFEKIFKVRSTKILESVRVSHADNDLRIADFPQ